MAGVITRHDEAGTPIAVHGMTITPVARVRRADIELGRFSASWAQARPSHVEVVHVDGTREEHRISDPGRIIGRVVATMTIALSVVAWIFRRRP